MKTSIIHIGITDKNNCVHAVTFKSGVNVITGRSSTGKSALIEIFDYCFGSSDFTVPEGIITEHADIYFVALKVAQFNLVLGRRRNENKVFIKSEPDDIIINNTDSFKKEYFNKDHFIPLEDFKKELRKYFGSSLQITDIEENLTDRKRRQNEKKSPTPSIRSFTSFMFQHQNLIANKHAIFYRFDEKEKREQAINHFKVFVGFVDQLYFIKCQDLDKLKGEERKLEINKPQIEELQANTKLKLLDALEEYLTISGTTLAIGDIGLAIINPATTLGKLYNEKVTIVIDSNEHIRVKQVAERELSKLTAEYRKVQNKLKDIKASIEFSENYKKETKQTIVPTKADLSVSNCPFCRKQNSDIEQNANKLSNAILWLNDELSKSEYFLDSFREDERQIGDELKKLHYLMDSKKTKINNIDKQTVGLEKYKSQYELALKAKLKVESILEEQLATHEDKFEEKLKKIREQIEEIEAFLKDKYDIKTKLNEAESLIKHYMNQISSTLEFEKSYKPVCLNFSLETFDLWNYMNGRKVFLRAMGSGANWLSCHIALFLALHRYFCGLGDKCAIPSVLFLDQPSQVYFPSILDNSEEGFSAEEINKKKPKDENRTVDADIEAVTNLYTELVSFCKDTLEQTGIEPQIIVTDHADKLKICNDTTTATFESLVRSRWRNRGFILSEDESSIIPE